MAQTINEGFVNTSEIQKIGKWENIRTAQRYMKKAREITGLDQLTFNDVCKALKWSNNI